MAAFAPFEPQPRLALAVSGGPDSTALALLARSWIEAHAGFGLVLVVDHGLREDSAREAARVAGRMRALGYACETLTWEGPKPTSGIEERAREARYALLRAACRRHGILHLLTGHQQDDQLETVAMRASRGSGPLGLAGMPAERFFPEVRLLRPLLGFSRLRLEATVRRHGLAVERDPLNLDLRFARARLRLRPLDRQRVAALAGAAAQARAAIEERLAVLAAQHVVIHPEGWAELGTEALACEQPELAESLLAHLVVTIGGGEHPPRRERVRRAVARLRATEVAALTLGGCILRRRRRRVTICREPAAVEGRRRLCGPGDLVFDGRFRIEASRAVDVDVMAVGEARACGCLPPGLVRPSGLPAAAFLALPLVMADGKPLALPPAWRVAPAAGIRVSFVPRRRFLEVPFCRTLFRPGEDLY